MEKVVVGKIQEINKHPNADKLKLVIVDIGSKKLEIVCGGTNLEDDQVVAVAQIGAQVLWHGEGEPVKLEPVEIRGAKSEGMICAANEIGLADAFPHEDREILDLGKGIPGMKVKLGTPLADALGLSHDVVMDIEVTSNRVDAMGMVGLAREASTILGKRFLWKPATMASQPKVNSQKPTAGVSVTVHDKKLCPRYMAVRIQGVKNGKSPWWMKQRLMSAGLNSISALVDITNYVLLEHAQPMHVFDVSKLKQGKRGPEIHVRLATAKEKMKALDGHAYQLDDRSLIVADAERPVAVAGVMGGEATGVDENTEEVILECATFEPVSVRRTARRLNLYSDSQLRFEKGLSTEAVPDAMARAVELTLELCGGTVVDVEDITSGKYKPKQYKIDVKTVNERIGVEITQKRQVEILENLGFKVKVSKGTITATVPWWRDHDIEDGMDLVEEIARVYGYENIPPELPIGEPSNRLDEGMLELEGRMKELLQGAGLTETYSYSFVSEELNQKANYSTDACLKLLNPLTDEYAYMRTSLLPSLLQVIADNQDRFKEQELFELSNVYYRRGKNWKELPDEQPELGCAYLKGEDSFRYAKGVVEHLLDRLGIEGLSWARFSESGFWHPGRSVQVFKDKHLLATIGEVSPQILEAFKIEGRVAMVDAPLQALIRFATDRRSYTAPNPFPESKRDLAVIVDDGVEYDDLVREICNTDKRITDVRWFDTYRGKGVDEGKKSVAVHLTISSPEKTLIATEVDGILERITLRLAEQFNATWR
ncbi:phenylalanine--tRNA ligase subunit beta [Candidatus Uhrbacteria bacterium]|nr:phenylalanine--tRNA ligase subunit beta [Candidatus Uhrbacteria bacterium]MBD3284003.1 phenylalanine--tRNA ligase subunit beta [Candidatus Uhrbacteria bacterium]